MGIWALALLGLAGCAQMATWQAPLLPGPSPLAVAAQLADEDVSSEVKSAIVDKVHARYQAHASPRNLLALAVVHGVPGHDRSSTTAARQWLERLDQAALSRSSRQLAAWLEQELAYSRALEKHQAETGRTIDELEQELAQAREKIRHLMQIESTVGAATREEAQSEQGAKRD